MPKADLYWYASCSQCRSARQELRTKGKEPRLIRRPLIVIRGKPIIGYDQAQLSAL